MRVRCPIPARPLRILAGKSAETPPIEFLKFARCLREDLIQAVIGIRDESGSDEAAQLGGGQRANGARCRVRTCDFLRVKEYRQFRAVTYLAHLTPWCDAKPHTKHLPAPFPHLPRTRKSRRSFPRRLFVIGWFAPYFRTAAWNSCQSSMLFRSIAPGSTLPSSGRPAALRMPLRTSSPWQ